MARTLRFAGVQSETWALALPGILLWPAAAILLYLGSRQHLGERAAFGGILAASLAPAAAVEMVHAFSLVHDDLPALDDDELRRGRPTLHCHAAR